jgi:hypothetical protein
MIHTDEDDEFDRIERENAMKSGQPYFFDEVYVSVSQRNQVLEEAAKACEGTFYSVQAADAIRGMKK